MTTTTILSDNGASSGSAGLKTTGGNDGTLVLQTTTTGGTATTALTIGTDQKVTLTKSLVLNGATSGATTLTPTDAVTATLTLPSTSGTVLTTTSPKTGNVLQVVQTTKTDTFSTASSYTSVTGLSASITPSSSSSKILITVSLGAISANNSSFKMGMYRGATPIYVGDAAGSRTQASAQGQTGASYAVQSTAWSYLDSPSTTSSTTYQVYLGSNGSVTVYLNRTDRDTNSSSEDARSASSIVLMEIAG